MRLFGVHEREPSKREPGSPRRKKKKIEGKKSTLDIRVQQETLSRTLR